MNTDREAQGHPEQNAILDIGGDVGALVLTTGAEYAGQEIEVSPLDDPAARIHTGIHARQVGARVVYAGIFPELKAGIYRIWADRPESASRVTIVGGEVAEVDWTAPDAERRVQEKRSDRDSG